MVLKVQTFSLQQSVGPRFIEFYWISNNIRFHPNDETLGFLEFLSVTSNIQ